MIRESQDIAKQSLEKYRKIERELELQKEHYEEEIARLNRANERLTKHTTEFKPTEQSTDKKGTRSKRTSSHKRLDLLSYEELR
jgi:hypothetical protein